MLLTIDFLLLTIDVACDQEKKFASPNLILSGWISESNGMTFWKFSLALVMGWSNSSSTFVFTSSSKTLFSISLVKTPSNWDANVSSFSVVVTGGLYPTFVSGDYGRIIIWSRLWVQN